MALGLGGWICRTRRRDRDPARRNLWVYKPRISPPEPRRGAACTSMVQGRWAAHAYALRCGRNSTAPLSISHSRAGLAHKMEALGRFTGSGCKPSPNPPASRGPRSPVCRAARMPRGATLARNAAEKIDEDTVIPSNWTALRRGDQPGRCPGSWASNAATSRAASRDKAAPRITATVTHVLIPAGLFGGYRNAGDN